MSPLLTTPEVISPEPSGWNCDPEISIKARPLFTSPRDYGDEQGRVLEQLSLEEKNAVRGVFEEMAQEFANLRESVHAIRSGLQR